MISPQNIGDRIVMIRKKGYNMTQFDFAELVLAESDSLNSDNYYEDVKRGLISMMSKLEHGRIVSVGHLLKIANRTGITLHFLITGDGDATYSANRKYSFENFKAAFKFHLKKAEMTLAGLANATGIPGDTINSYTRSNGSIPRLGNLEKIVNVLGVTYDQLFVEPKEEEP